MLVQIIFYKDNAKILILRKKDCFFMIFIIQCHLVKIFLPKRGTKRCIKLACTELADSDSYRKSK